MTQLNLEHIRPLQDELNQHPIYESLRDIEDLRVFMSHHIFSVWDFMSLTKYLQGKVSPVQIPWMPNEDATLRYFINQLVLEEESDALTVGDQTRYASHFESYLDAMREIDADTDKPLRFLDLVREKGVDEALYSDLVPMPARYFSETTFCLIREDKPHLAAAGLALGRERLIPEMFRRFIDSMGIGRDQAPAFHRYLERHIELDAGFHGPLSLRLLDHLCGGDATKIEEAETAAEEAICARIRFWDGVLDAIKAGRV